MVKNADKAQRNHVSFILPTMKSPGKLNETGTRIRTLPIRPLLLTHPLPLIMRNHLLTDVIPRDYRIPQIGCIVLEEKAPFFNPSDCGRTYVYLWTCLYLLTHEREGWSNSTFSVKARVTSPLLSIPMIILHAVDYYNACALHKLMLQPSCMSYIIIAIRAQQRGSDVTWQELIANQILQKIATFGHRTHSYF